MSDTPNHNPSKAQLEPTKELILDEHELQALPSSELEPCAAQTGLQLSARSKLITACLFDLDGTLVDTTADITTAVNEARAHFELPALSLEQVARGIGHGATALLEATFPPELMSERLTEVRGRFMEAYQAHLCEQSAPYEGVEEALSALQARGVTLALVTNKPEELTAPLLAHLGWHERFEVVDARRADRLSKPHPEPIFRVMRALNLKADEVLFVGDSEVDARAALAAGVEFMSVPYGRVASEVFQGFYGSSARVATWYDLRRELLEGSPMSAHESEGVQAQQELELLKGEPTPTLELEAGGSPELEAGGSPELEAGGSTELEAGGSTELEAGGSLELEAGGSPELEAPQEPLPLFKRLRFGARRARARLSALDDERRRLMDDYKEHFLGAWDLLIVTLSVFTLMMMISQLVWRVEGAYLELLHLLDWIICGFFLFDFFLRLLFSKDRLGYLKWGWLDLLSSLPQIEALRWGRSFRLLRLLRALKAMRTLKRKLEARVQDSFALLLASSFMLTSLSALGVLYLETGLEGANIKSAQDALWWAWVTITTVGYGDFYPVSPQGRLIAMFLMSAGVGLFSVFTVQCTRYFLNSATEEESKQLNELRDEVRALRELMMGFELRPRELDDAHDEPSQAQSSPKDQKSEGERL